MRDRLVAAFVILIAVGALLFGLPKAYQLADLVEDQQRAEVAGAADQTVHLLAVAGDAGLEVTPRLLAGGLGADDTAVYQAADGTEVTSQTPPGPGDLSVTRAVPGGGSVTIARSAASVEDRVGSALLWLVVPGVALLAAALAAGLLLARRLARPFEDLAVAADRLGAGEFDLDIAPQRVPEADRVAESLHDSARRLETLSQRERELAVDASHLLRTPVTAIRLGLEDLSSWPETHPVVQDELHRVLAELDRLSLAVTGLVEQRRTVPAAPGTAAPLLTMLEEELERVGATLVARGPAGAAYPRAAARQLARAVGQVAGDRGRVDVAQHQDLVRLTMSRCTPGLVRLRGLEEATAVLGGSLAADGTCDRVTLWLPVVLAAEVASGT
ncbi:HAMP domain-containing protein [Nocardioides ferulae]|uniref:HAMP domain-containing protein n=1 Tax=Nocardioides ferulae TaxID=2340821 RepID=UPI0013DE5248|nr:HAMP domain-containing protein [Nocardioides ferulae]